MSDSTPATPATPGYRPDPVFVAEAERLAALIVDEDARAARVAARTPDRVATTVTVYEGTRELTPEAVSDFSATVYGHHVVNQPERVESEDGMGEPAQRSYRWRMVAARRDLLQPGAFPLFEALADVADLHGVEFTLDSAGITASASYRGGDRAWAAERAALRSGS